MRSVFFSAILLAWILFSTSQAEDFPALVTFVKDGDTFEARRNGETVTIRLFGIDCPEKGQPFADAARKFTESQVLNKTVQIHIRDRDRYGRLVAEVTGNGKENLNQALVREGFAWHYKKHSKDPAMAALENQARAEKKGVWRDIQPTAPWDYRAQHRIWASREQPRSKASTPAPTPTRKPTASDSSGKAEKTDGRVIANRRSKVYHHPDCPNGTRISAANRIEFPSASKAEAAGYRLCAEEKKKREGN